MAALFAVEAAVYVPDVFDGPRVHGWENLYACDASVFPTAVRVNPQLTVTALAHRAGSQCVA